MLIVNINRGTDNGSTLITSSNIHRRKTYFFHDENTVWHIRTQFLGKNKVYKLVPDKNDYIRTLQLFE